MDNNEFLATVLSKVVVAQTSSKPKDWEAALEEIRSKKRIRDGGGIMRSVVVWCLSVMLWFGLAWFVVLLLLLRARL